ncbi:hypothetical protein BKA64DRAFT_649584 [Cadophora sp. MPI-SDFR-AT-0126]|nr:hypothetical protein BKA64DRAFT_649584 [Leotiomycetes sp. MPI-SDFR-AT-0126]
MSTASEKANLARIRDNQRRSRARRKEYLQELEARLRQCELQGIEASAEIQMAARAVANENKKLRVLLAQHGIGDDKVEVHLQSSPGAESDMRSQYGSSSVAVQLLEGLLQARKPCYSNGNTGAPTNFRMPADSWQYSAGKQAPINQLMTPSSSSQASSAVLGHSSDHSISHYQRLTPVSLPRNPSPAANHSRQNPQMHEFDIQQSLSSSYNNEFSTVQQHLQPPHSRTQSFSIDTDSFGEHECHELCLCGGYDQDHSWGGSV